LGRAHTEAELVDFASRAAALAPAKAPGPHRWIFVKSEYADSAAGSGAFLFEPPTERLIGLQWIRVDHRQYATITDRRALPATLPLPTVVHGRLTISPGGSGFTLGGWKSVSYRYLQSLPASPPRLKAIILAADTPGKPWYTASPNLAIFNAISTLLIGQTEGVWIPPRLAANMYRVL
jgi:hypothetical protein